MSFAERRKRFQAMLRADACIHPGSMYDPLSARLVEDAGFDLGIFAGSTASLTILAAPDDVLITLTEFAEQAYRVARACTLPVLVDADHGYGNALNVRRTVEELEVSGISALTIEDTELPLGFGKGKKGALISLAEGVGKMRAAVSARGDQNLAIIGRTSAVTFTSVEDAIERGKAYADCGIDAMFFAGIETRAQLEAVAAAIKLPIVLGYPGKEIQDLKYLASCGVRICLQGHTPIRAAVQALHEAYKALRAGVPPGQMQGLASPELMDKLTHKARYAEWTKDYMTDKS